MKVSRLILIQIILLMVIILWGGGEFSPREREYNFGDVYERDGKAGHKFIFKNTGDELLRLIDVHAS